MAEGARAERIRHAAEERLARLESGRRSGFVLAVAKRFGEIEGATAGGLLAIELFTTVLPLMIIGFGASTGFAKDASLGAAMTRELGLHAPLDRTLRDTFGSSDALASTWTVLGVAGFLLWGIPMSLTVAGMFQRAWRREPFSLGERLWRGALWFVLYLVVMVLHHEIAFSGDEDALVRLVRVLLAAVPTWVFWSASPVLLVRDGGRGARFLAWSGLVGVAIQGIALPVAFRITFPMLLEGWTGFGPIGVSMAIMTWCGVLGTSWVVTTCLSAELWDRLAPARMVVAAGLSVDEDDLADVVDVAAPSVDGD